MGLHRLLRGRMQLCRQEIGFGARSARIGRDYMGSVSKS